MLRKIFYVAIPLVLIVVGSPAAGHAAMQTQAKVRTFSPPIVNVELSGVEPVPSGTNPSVELSFAGGGGGEDVDSKKILRWEEKPEFSYPFIYDTKDGVRLTACSADSGSDPVATLISPGGKRTPVSMRVNDSMAINAESGQEKDTCWTHSFESSYGMELGQYTLDVSSKNGSLSHTWIVDYPFYSTMRYIGDARYALMGFAADQTVRVNFYRRDDADNGGSPYSFLATRQMKLDNEGAIVFKISVTRNAPFEPEQVLPVLVAPAPQFPTFATDSFDENLGAQTVFQMPEYQYFKITPVEASESNENINALPHYMKFDNTLIDYGNFPNDIPMEVLEHRAIFRDGHTMHWLLLTDGADTGWTYFINGQANLTLSPIKPRLAAGGNVRSGFDKSLRDAANSDAKEIGTLPAGQSALVLQVKPDEPIPHEPEQGGWCLVQTSNGLKGWASFNHYEALPWPPVEVKAQK